MSMPGANLSKQYRLNLFICLQAQVLNQAASLFYEHYFSTTNSFETVSFFCCFFLLLHLFYVIAVGTRTTECQASVSTAPSKHVIISSEMCKHSKHVSISMYEQVSKYQYVYKNSTYFQKHVNITEGACKWLCNYIR